MTDQQQRQPSFAELLLPPRRPITPPPCTAEQALAALGGPLDPGDFRTIDQARHSIIHAALIRLHQLEESND